MLQFIRFKKTINLGKNSVDLLHEEIKKIEKNNKNINDGFQNITKQELMK